MTRVMMKVWLFATCLCLLGQEACGTDDDDESPGDDDTTTEPTETPDVDDSGNATIDVDLDATVGTVRALNGVQGGPAGINEGDPDLSTYYLEAAVPLVRLPQDDGFSYTLGGIFPDADADPNDPASYEFGPIDASVGAIVDIGADVLWEATYDIGGGDSWVGCCMTGTAPTDLEKWGNVVEHVLMHFNDGWADGHNWNVRFVESINEPFMLGVYDRADFEACWQAFAALSKVIDRYNARTGRSVQVVAYADPILTLDEGPGTDLGLMGNFLDFVAAEGLTLDAFSYHSYSDPEFQADIAWAARDVLDRAGFEDVALFNSEWNNALTVDPSAIGDPLHINAYRAASETQTKILLQEVVDQAVVYRGNQRGYHGEETPTDNTFFSETGEPMPAYYGWLVFRDAETLTPVRVSASGAEAPLVAMASRSEDSSLVSIIIANWQVDPESAEAISYRIQIQGLTPSTELPAALRVVTHSTSDYEPVETDTLAADAGGTAVLEDTVPAWSVHYWLIGE